MNSAARECYDRTVPSPATIDDRPLPTREDRDEHGQLSDDALMIRLQEGDNTAFDHLVARHSGPLRGYFLRKLRDHSVADDLVQDTLLKVHLNSWDYIPLGRFRGWMYRIAHNLTVDTVRRQARDVVLSAYRGFDEDESDRTARFVDSLIQPDEQAERRERAARLETLLEDLPDDQRDTVVLHYYNGVPLPEVAEIMETNLSTCKSRLRLAREKLAGRIEAAGLSP